MLLSGFQGPLRESMFFEWQLRGSCDCLCRQNGSARRMPRGMNLGAQG